VSRVVRILTALALVLVALPVLTAAGNGQGDAARAEHQRIIDFWTPERVAQAVPRDFVFDPGTGRFGVAKPDNPGGGGKPGGGGGSTSVVSGSSWTDGGAVADGVGKVLFAMDGSYWICSASVVDDPSNNARSIILTAGHCVYDETNGAFATNWMFIPNYDAAPAQLTSSGSFCGQTQYGCWTATSLVVHDGFASAGGFNDQAVLYDWGFAVVGLGGHDGSTSVETIADFPASFTSVATNGTVTGYAFGYPAEKKYRGDDLIYCSNAVDGDPYNADLTYRMNECKLNGGSSGGGWFRNFSNGSGILFSVNSYGYTGVNAMHGPFFNGYTTATYNAALTTNSDTVVGG